jgi:hypothetical protein
VFSLREGAAEEAARVLRDVSDCGCIGVWALHCGREYQLEEVEIWFRGVVGFIYAILAIIHSSLESNYP